MPPISPPHSRLDKRSCCDLPRIAASALTTVDPIAIGPGIPPLEPSGGCRRVAGLPDVRSTSDRYLGLDDDRARAERLETERDGRDWLALAGRYYDLSGESMTRRRRFLNHLRAAEGRGRTLLATLDGPDRGPILELGSGSGGFLVAASKAGLACVGIDLASRWLVVARARLLDAGVRPALVAAEAEQLPWTVGVFDHVVADSLIEHLDDPDATLAEAFRVLRPGGSLVLWSPNRWSVLPDPHVGLWGVGWLPRRWGVAWAYRASRGAWLPHCRSARDVEARLRRLGFVDVDVSPAPLDRDCCPSSTWVLRIAERLYRGLAGWSVTRALLTQFGPVWAIRATKPPLDA